VEAKEKIIMAEEKQLTQVEIETNLLKTTFQKNENLLKLLRKLFFSFELSQEEKLLIKKTFENKELREAFRKKIYSKRGDDANLGNIADEWVSITDEKLVGFIPEDIYKIIQSRIKLYQMFDRGMALLENPDGERVELSFIPSSFTPTDILQISVDLMARNKYLNSIEAGLSFINIIANSKDKTSEEIKEEMKKNSNK
jgi:hypothetical protein